MPSVLHVQQAQVRWLTLNGIQRREFANYLDNERPATMIHNYYIFKKYRLQESVDYVYGTYRQVAATFLHTI